MRKICNNDNGFSVIEVVIAVVIIAVVGLIGRSLYEKHRNSTADNTTITSNTQPRAYVGQSMKISQLDIEIPINGSLTGLYYWWDGTQAWILSPTVNQYANEEDPSDCSADPASLTSENGSGNQDFDAIGLIYPGSGGSEEQWKTITINNQTYTLTNPTTSCSSNQNIANEVNTYEQYLEKAFVRAQSTD